MAREKKPAGLIGLRLEISPEHRDRLLIASAKRGQSMAACLRQLVAEWIDTHEPVVPPAKVSRPRKTKETAN
jgi:hypothetical protein